jgi:hypothetical protein
MIVLWHWCMGTVELVLYFKHFLELGRIWNNMQILHVKCGYLHERRKYVLAEKKRQNLVRFLHQFHKRALVLEILLCNYVMIKAIRFESYLNLT